MKKGIFIVAGVLAVGGLAYLYFANKKKQASLLAGGTFGAGSTSATPTTSTSTTGVGASPINSEIPPLSTGGIVTTTTVAPTPQGQEDLQKAKDLAEKIKKYYQLSATRELVIARWRPSTFSRTKPTNSYPALISKLKDDLLKLGYEYKGEKDGILVKL